MFSIIMIIIMFFVDASMFFRDHGIEITTIISLRNILGQIRKSKRYANWQQVICDVRSETSVLGQLVSKYGILLTCFLSPVRFVAWLTCTVAHTSGRCVCKNKSALDQIFIITPTPH